MAQLICGECKRVVLTSMFDHFKEHHNEIYQLLLQDEEKLNRAKVRARG